MIIGVWSEYVFPLNDHEKAEAFCERLEIIKVSPSDTTVFERLKPAAGAVLDFFVSFLHEEFAKEANTKTTEVNTVKPKDFI